MSIIGDFALSANELGELADPDKAARVHRCRP
jgi:hypothetical protein